ncbi:MAG: class I SAM-dependent methyltransferase [Myxococcota bacterium]
MTIEAGDTSERSLAHWSEAQRKEMDAFYAVATQDYRELAQAWPWAEQFESALHRKGSIRILDVACGSGKFPSALRQHTSIGAIGGTPISIDLLDPSAFSLAEARRNLAAPMTAGQDFECTLQELPSNIGSYDLVWAVHALYALPEHELDAGTQAFLRALGGGLGFIAHARSSAHYLRFYEAYRKKRPDATPYTDGDAVEAAFRRAGASVEVQELHYEQLVQNEAVLEGFLQRCLFDSELTLEDMRADSALGAYLESTRTDDGYCFSQDVAMLFIRR